MSENNFNCEFWKEIEKEVGGLIPNMIKIVFSKSGYEHHFSLQNLTNSDINEIEEYAMNKLKDKLKRWLKSDSNYEHLNPSEFAFLPGHRKIICIISQKLTAAKEVKSVPTSSESVTNVESAEIDGEANASSIVSNKLANKHGDNVLISIEKQAQLEAELCKHVSQWMIGKKFHDSVSNTNIHMHLNIEILIFEFAYFLNFNLYIAFDFFSFNFQICALNGPLGPPLIQNLVGFIVNGVTEYKCQIKCPVCDKITHANHRMYIVGNRKRRADKGATQIVRKAAWYFSSLQSHLSKLKNSYRTRNQ